MSTIPTRALRTGVELSTLGFGGAPLGELFDPVSESQAQDTLQAAWDAGIRYYDTAPFYGYGKSEHRLGYFLRQQQRKDFVLSTKVGRVLTATRDLDSFEKGFWIGGLPFDFRFDYGYDGIMRSWEDSLQRLSLNSIDLLLIHDLDSFFHDSEQRFSAHVNHLITSGWRALDELRSQGLSQGRRRGPQPHGSHAAPARRGRPRLLHRRHALHALGPRLPRRGIPPLRGARRAHRHRLGFRFRHPRLRPGRRCPLRL